MHDHILVAIDGSVPALRGLDEALRLARTGGGRLRLLHVVDVLPDPPRRNEAASPADGRGGVRGERGVEIVHAAAERARAAGVSCETVLKEFGRRRLCDIICSEAERWPAQLIVIGTHGRRGLDRLMLGGTTEQILRAAPVPVMTVCASPPRQADGPRSALRGGRSLVLVPVDGGAASFAGLHAAIRLGLQQGAMLRLVHVANAVSFFLDGEMQHIPAAEWPQMLCESGRRVLLRAAAMVGDAGLDVETTLIEPPGRPLGDVVAEEALACGADTIVVGTHSGGDLRHALLGSDAARIVRVAPVPVIVVPLAAHQDEAGAARGADAVAGTPAG